MKLINGYLVVRKPDYCSRFIEGVGRIQVANSVGNLNYLGVDRLQWETIEDEYYSNELSDSGKELYSKINQKTAHGLKVVKEYQLAIDILQYSNRSQEENEIIGIYSEQLTEIVGCKEVEPSLNFIGIDPWYDGYGSMINSGLFMKPDLFKEYFPLVNQFGLFDIEENARNYVDFYRRLSLQQEVEPMAGEIEYIHIWRV